MRNFRARRPAAVDFDHMKTLHEECVEQLELMAHALQSAQLASDLARDRLDDMAVSHWHAYIDVIHLVSMHDEAMNGALKKIGLDMRTENEDEETQYQLKRALLLSLTDLLIRHHRRVVYIYNLNGEPMKDYLADASLYERECIANVLEMVHAMV